MPKRSASHQLEDVSKRAFRALFPRQWVVRDVTYDYGIDQEVEIFNDDGSFTGLIFLVQLRATASPILKKQNSATFKVEQLDYFLSHDIPVLIFRFAEHAGKFYYRWAQELTREIATTPSKSIVVNFDDSNLWTDNGSYCALGDARSGLLRRKAIRI